MTDLIQILDRAHHGRSGARPTTPGSLRHHHRRSSRSPTPDPTTPPGPLRSRRARRTSRAGDAPDGSDDQPRSPPAPRREIAARPAPYAPVPSTPTRAIVPKPVSQPCNCANPAGVVANDSTPNTPPFASTAAATCTSTACRLHPSSGACSLRWSSPSLLSNGQGVARTSREGDRDESTVRTAKIDHPPERGVPNSSTVRSTGAPIKRAVPTVQSRQCSPSPVEP